MAITHLEQNDVKQQLAAIRSILMVMTKNQAGSPRGQIRG